MKRIFHLGLPLFASLLLSSCGTSDSFRMGGVPAWIADGAKLEDEPAPVKPDPAIQSHENESGPVMFEWITDKRHYKAPPVKKAPSTRISDPLERGRDSRIKRLFR
ncbi:MAG: hypothetical protein KA250_07955 [Verrucomicrobiales bacterium]|jgi:hypothetical protein|nr:hypothetical protein [Verrucomicrobiales bacterium]MBP9225421.1 hypothetical protein [Verrucomicrobiales bacterium]HQZ27118.1 hypothetical protein [Verrucomicrobiales bacterium]